MARSKVKAKAKTRAKAKANVKVGTKAAVKRKTVAKRKTQAGAKARPAAKRGAAKRTPAGRPPAGRASARKAGARRGAPAAKRTTAKRPVSTAGKPAMSGRRILDLAQVIRSKNAGPFEVTFDIMFDSANNYRMVRDSGVITRKLIARLYGISENAVLVCRPYDPAQAIKITIRRPVSSGDIGDSDVYGCQQHVPLTTILVPM